MRFVHTVAAIMTVLLPAAVMFVDRPRKAAVALGVSVASLCVYLLFPTVVGG